MTTKEAAWEKFCCNCKDKEFTVDNGFNAGWDAAMERAAEIAGDTWTDEYSNPSTVISDAIRKEITK